MMLFHWILFISKVHVCELILSLHNQSHYSHQKVSCINIGRLQAVECMKAYKNKNILEIIANNR